MKIHRHMVDHVVHSLSEIFSQGFRADKVIERALKTQKKWGSRDRKFFAESIYECVRWQRRLLALSKQTFPLDQAGCQRLWLTWAYDVGWLLNPAEWDFDPVEFEKQKKNFEKTATRAEKESIPDWMDELGRTELGDRWDAVLHALNQKAPVDLRVNTLKTTREKVRAALHDEEIDTDLIQTAKDGLTLVERKNVFITKAFHSGFFEVQDRASQLVAPLLDPQPGDRVADACAGAGGKTLHLAALMKNKGRLLSLDIHEWKLNELRLRARRAGVDIVETRLIESSKTIKRLAESFDRVLLDVPCSGMGVLRRNPDSKWKLSLEDIERMCVLQSEILTSYSRLVKPGGTLVYATCSLLPRENEKQVEAFLAGPTGPEWTVIDKISILPDKGSGDGFFAAKLVRTAQ